MTEGCTLYLPSTRMLDFKRQIIIFIHNFVPSNDESITSSYFFTLGKTGKPNQASWMMPFHILGKCIQIYNPSKFKDIDSAVKFNVGKTILSNRMFFWDECNWCDKRTVNISSYNKLALLTDLICKNFMRGFVPRFCKWATTTVCHYSWKTCLGCMQGVVSWGEDSRSTEYCTWM